MDSKWRNRFIALAALLLMAGPIKNWSTNEYITYTDLNYALNHLHANLGHGHGPIITANDIASNAKIRPEQTTFGSSINRALVFNGTFNKNLDGGTNYIPINSYGSLDVSVVTSATGYVVNAAAEAGALPDAGTRIYTVLTRGTDLGLGPTAFTPFVCFSSNGGSLFYSPLQVSELCQAVTSFGGAATYLSPNAVSVAIYNNKVQ